MYLKLVIDTSDNKKTIVELDDLQLVEKYDSPREQRLVELVEKILEKKKSRIRDITKIKVNSGPGSYTGLRVGCAVANALAWILRVAINGKKTGEFVYPDYKG